jgi:hypothetical protein
MEYELLLAYRPSKEMVLPALFDDFGDYDFGIVVWGRLTFPCNHGKFHKKKKFTNFVLVSSVQALRRIREEEEDDDWRV